MTTEEFYKQVAENRAKSEAKEALKCKYSNYSFSSISPPKGFEWTTKNWKGLELSALICPSCGKPVFLRKHPNSGNDYVIIPSHNKAVK